jgi:hypothetical protein
MADDRCSNCGSEMSSASRYCVKCGRQRPAPVLDLERLDVAAPPPPPLPASQIERAVAEQRRAQPPRRRSLLVIGLVLAVLVAAVIVLSGGDGDGDDATDDADAATTSTTEAPTRTTRPPRTTTTLPPVIIGQIGAPGPILGASTEGLSLYAIAGSTIARVELDTGTVTVVRSAFRRGGGYTSSLFVSGDQLVATRDSDVYVIPKDLSGEPQRLDGVIGDSLSTERLVSVTYDGPDNAPISAQEYDVRGEVVNEWRLPAGVWPSGVVGDRLVLVAGGRIFLLGTDGSVEPFANGDLMSVSGSFVSVRRCDDAMRCRVTIDNPLTGESVPAPALDLDFGYWYGRSLSPDGRTALVSGPTDLQLVEVATGDVIADLEELTQPAWTPDSEWLFSLGDRDMLLAISTSGRGTIELPMPQGFRAGTSDLILAVG